MTLGIVLGVAVIGPFLILLAGDRVIGWRRRRRIRNELAALPPLGATSVEGTIVRVTGTVRAMGATLVAPLSGAECVVVQARVKPYIRGSQDRMRTHVWFEIVPFALDREAKPSIIVDGAHARIDLDPTDNALPRGWAPEQHRRRMELREAMRQREQQLLQKLELSPTMPALYVERTLQPGTRVSIAGVFMLGEPAENDDGERGFRELGPASLRITGDANHPLIIGEPVIDDAS